MEGLRRERMAALARIPGQEGSVGVAAGHEALPLEGEGEGVMTGRAEVLRHNMGVAGTVSGPGDAVGVAPSSEAFVAAGGGPGAVEEGGVVCPTPPIISTIEASARGGMEGAGEVVAAARSKEIVI